jgi:putative lipoic acid-binding regulatory protein
MSEKTFQAGKVAIKVFIDNDAALEAEITHLIQTEFPNLNSSNIKSTPSQNKNFLSLTYQIDAKEDDEPKLHRVYTNLSQHPKVKMVL